MVCLLLLNSKKLRIYVFAVSMAQFVILILLLAPIPGSQAVVSFVLEKELSTEPFSLVAEEVNT